MKEPRPTREGSAERNRSQAGTGQQSPVRVFLRRYSALPVLVLLGIILGLLAAVDLGEKNNIPGTFRKDRESTRVEPERLVEMLDELGDRPLTEVWNRVHALRGHLARDAGDPTPLLVGERKLFDLSEHGKLAGATLIVLTRREKALRDAAQTALMQLAFEGSSSEVRSAAIQLLGREGDFERVYPALNRLLKSCQNSGTPGNGGPKKRDEAGPRLVLVTWTALWQLDNTISPQPVRRLLRGPEYRWRAEAALQLAQAGHYDNEVLEMLHQLREEPSDRGSRARLLYRLYSHHTAPDPSSRRSVEIPPSGNGTEPRPEASVQRDALEELIEILRRKFVEPEQIQPQEIYERAFKAAIGRLPYSRFLSPGDLEHLESRSLGQHLGLGALFVKLGRDSDLVVVKPYYKGPGVNSDRSPADRLYTGDRVMAIDGVPTTGQSAEDIRSLLEQKDSGDVVYLKVKRWDEAAPRILELPYGTVEVPTLRSEILPEGIGYVKLRRINSRTAKDLESALQGWIQKDLLASLILDLRDNPGGSLQAAVKIIDIFVVGEGRPIVSEVRAAGEQRREYTPTAKQLVPQPLVVLVNRWTASASEVIAGSLQDFGRAIIIGEQTYGKGVSQEQISAPALVNSLVGGTAQIQVATYYLELPSGRRFHGERDLDGRPIPGREGGIEPDIQVQQIEESFTGWQLEEFRRVQYSRELSDYIGRYKHEIRNLWEEGQNLWEPGPDSGFDQLYASLKTRLRKQDVLIALRKVLRRHLEDEQEREFVTDLPGDHQLQTSVRLVLKELGMDDDELASHPTYGVLGRPDSSGE